MKHLLCKVPIFAGLDDKALKVFLENAERTEVPVDGVIALEGEDNDRMYLIEAGEVCIIKKFDTPSAVKLAALGPGDFFGEMCIMETLPVFRTRKSRLPRHGGQRGVVGFLRAF